jgi:hypothetical protein
MSYPSSKTRYAPLELGRGGGWWSQLIVSLQTYNLVYRAAPEGAVFTEEIPLHLSAGAMVEALQNFPDPSWISAWCLNGSHATEIVRRIGGRRIKSAYRDALRRGWEYSSDSDISADGEVTEDPFTRTLQLLSVLNLLSTGPSDDSKKISLRPDDFISSSLTTQLVEQLQNPLAVAADALPPWCNELTSNFPFLFSLASRHSFFAATSFGPSRALAWAQEQDARGESAGRLTSERVVVQRNDGALLDWAKRVMDAHAGHHSMLDVVFLGEAVRGEKSYFRVLL